MTDLVKTENKAGIQPRKRVPRAIKVKPAEAPIIAGYSPEAMALVQGIADRAEDEADLIVGLEQNYDRILDAGITRRRQELAPKLEAHRVHAAHQREQQAIANQNECRNFVTDFYAGYGLELE